MNSIFDMENTTEKMKRGITALLLLLITAVLPAQHYLAEEGKVYFKSDAPLELIEARSTAMRAIIDADKRTFAFSVPISSFEGFNSPLQRVHFNENYLESDRYPAATFSGKIIEKVNFTAPGTYTVRAKGKLTVHGIEQERIIKSELTVSGAALTVRAAFTVLLDEHDITIPKIVYQKIAEEIEVEVEAVFTPE